MKTLFQKHFFKTLIFWLITINCSYAQIALNTSLNKDKDAGGAGNGQLVVIPKGHTKPVPYESVRAWETGRYLNFYRLPNVNNNFEPRDQFNRSYGVYAIDWLTFLQTANNKIYHDLIRAAKETSFRFVNDFIAWNSKIAKDGEIDYKKYENAAYYNGEIILSIPVMDSIGPLSNKITKKQNQGFIVIKELMHAAYPGYSESETSKLCEAILKARFLGDNKEDLLYNLSTVDFYFLTYDGSREVLLNIINELLNYEKNSDRKNKLQKMQYYIATFWPDEFDHEIDLATLQKSLLEEISRKKMNSVPSIDQFFTDLKNTLQSLNFPSISHLLTKEFLKEISKVTGLSLLKVSTLNDPFTATNLINEMMNDILSALRKQYLTYIENNLSTFMKSFSKGHIRKLGELVYLFFVDNNYEYFLNELPKAIKLSLTDPENFGLLELENNFYTKIFDEEKNTILPQISTALLAEFCSRGYCVDVAKSKNYKIWQLEFANSLIAKNSNQFPFKPKDQFFLLHPKWDEDAAFEIYNVTSVDYDEKIITTRSNGEKRHFGVNANYDFDFDRNKIYSITNLDRLLFLK